MIVDIAYTQHLGRNPSQQDALWNSREIIQQRDVPVNGLSFDSTHAGSLVVAVADGVAISPMPHKASKFVLEALACEMEEGAALDARTIRRIHGRLCDVLAKGKSFGSATTLASVAYPSQAACCSVISVGDSRVYRIAADGNWQPLTRDHTLLNAMIERGEADPATEYASLYNALDSCLIADDEETEFRIHYEHAPFLEGDSILLCTDGVHDTLGDAKLQKLTDLVLTPCAQVEVWRKAILAAGAPDNFSIILLRRTTP
jgi:Serine/threonine protein phosphatase